MSTPESQQRRWRIAHAEVQRAVNPNAFGTLVRIGIALEDEQGTLDPTKSFLMLPGENLSRAELAQGLLDLASHIEAGK